MRDIEFCAQILKLDQDWSVSEIEIDEPSNRIDITIAFGTPGKKSLFKRSNQDAIKTVALRHLPLFGLRTFLHVPEATAENKNKRWSPAGSKFTQEMEDLTIAAIKSNKSIQGVSEVTGLTASDIREISERTGHAIERIATPAPQAESQSEPEQYEHGISQSFEIVEMGDVPAETHANWLKLIEGQISLESNAVGLQMLMQRIKQEIASSPTETTRLAGIRLLRQYFIKNQALHKSDIEIINGTALPTPGDKPALEVIQGGLPGEQHQCWQRIISGELKIETAHVGLQMMMERVRLSVENSPSNASRLAGAKILRQFFIKYKNRLKPEIRQLGIEPEATHVDESPPMTGALPAINHPCWQKLIAGELQIKTDAVGLQMMMERVRQSIHRNPSDSNRIAGIKILHQYFLKHQARHKTEIQALLGNVVETETSDGHVHIPAESHHSWQRLINGELEIMTDAVALKMMLERIRISVENNPTVATRMAGAKILRQYFIKHQHKHRAELDQLIAA